MARKARHLRMEMFGRHWMFQEFYAGRRMRNKIEIFDTVAQESMPPTISNGSYAFATNQGSAVAQMNNFPNFYR
jgi:hypothetical protein